MVAKSGERMIWLQKKKYTDFEGHVEFLLMGKRGDAISEGYSNSGVYMQNRYELQIESPKGEDALDPYNWKIGKHGMGAFCLERVPDHNLWRPNGVWHAFHFVFKAARYEGDKIVENARVTVWWNGVKIHDNVPIKRFFPALGSKLGRRPVVSNYRNMEKMCAFAISGLSIRGSSAQEPK